ncbi:MAG: hypothetical protein KF862_06050 [Chitinophagaceae bacterium]|nr:hypothetical protein [Chitinophagaceae bacterium]
MKHLILIYSLTLLAYSLFGQNEIEIRVNDIVQNNTQVISVSKPNDKIELRIYSPQKDFLIDSLKSEGCGTKTVFKKRFIFIESRGQQQRQQSSTRPMEEKYEAITYIKPTYKNGYYYFTFNVQEVTGCKGKFFYLTPTFDNNKSNLKSLLGFQKKYKFIYIYE